MLKVLAEGRIPGSPSSDSRFPEVAGEKA